MTGHGLRSAIAGLGAPGVSAILAVGAAGVVCVAMLPGLLGAVLTPVPKAVELPASAAQDQAAGLAASRAAIDGRTMFFVPARPPAPVRAISEDNRPLPPPSPPAVYGGPALIGMIFDTVWFADGRKLKVGEGDEADLRVVRLEAPWAAVLKWKGIEFTVKVFDRDSVVLKSPGEKMAEGTPPVLPPPSPESAAPAPPPSADTPAPTPSPPTAEPSGEPEDGPPDSSQEPESQP